MKNTQAKTQPSRPQLNPGKTLTLRPPAAISVSLSANVALQLGRTEEGTYSHERFETNCRYFETDLGRTVALLQKCQDRLKSHQTPAAVAASEEEA